MLAISRSNNYHIPRPVPKSGPSSPPPQFEPAFVRRQREQAERARERQFVEMAQRLRQKIYQEFSAYYVYAEQLLNPLKKLPRNRHETRLYQKALAFVPQAWRQMPAFGRLRCTLNHDKKRFQVIEARLAAGHQSMDDWDKEENSIALVVRTVLLAPPTVRDESQMLATISLHALARRYQRGFGALIDENILKDIMPIGLYYPDITKDPIGSDFRVDVENGYWCGTLVENQRGTKILAVRTFKN